MSAAQLNQILYRAIGEPDFRSLLLAGRDEAFAGYELTPGEQAKLKALTPAAFNGIVGGLITHHLLPLRAAGRFVIVPGLADYAPAAGDVPIFINPDWVFGNGAHPTTVLSLSAIDTHVRPGDSLLDIGAGTGILSIAAARLGAGRVLALDIAPEAVQAARQNVLRNGVESVVQVEQGSLAEALEMKDRWHVVVVNILGPVVLQLLAEGLASALRPGGTLIASAIKDAEVEPIRLGLQNAGLAPVEHRRLGDWLSLVARKSPAASPEQDSISLPKEGAYVCWCRQTNHRPRGGRAGVPRTSFV